MPVVGVCRGSIVPAVVLEDKMMDIKEAIKELEDLTVDYGDRNEEQIARLDEAIDMAMGALKAQADGDTISRKAAIHAMEGVDWYHINKDGQLTHGANSKEDEPLYKAKDVYKVLNDMPSAQPETHEERTETHACDCIKRQAVERLDWFTKLYCRDKSITDDLTFRCKQCEFEMPDKTCLVKVMARKLCPDYKGFGAMGDL